VQAKLYSLRISSPSRAAQSMIELKGIEPKVVNMLPGMHHRLMRLRGFPRPTVPGVKLDGRRVQGTREIARFLDEIRPEPPLFPSDPEARVALEDAERWADEVLQNTPRRILRLQGAQSQAFRRWFAKEQAGLPLPGLAAAVNITEARRIAKVVDADEAHVREEVERLPEKVAHIDGLISRGVIGGERPNAADFQIAASFRLLLMLDRVGPALDGGPAGAHARRLYPEAPGTEPIPWMLPDEWLAPLESK
jgi:glutathione S-transferase